MEEKTLAQFNAKIRKTGNSFVVSIPSALIKCKVIDNKKKVFIKIIDNLGVYFYRGYDFCFGFFARGDL